MPPVRGFIETPTRTPPPRFDAESERGAGAFDPLEAMAWLMDRAILIPGTRFRVGLDAILGLLPFGGDVLTGFAQVAWVVVAVGRDRVPRALAAQMAANVLLDTLVGAIPIVGDVFDAYFKANTRNMELLRNFRAQKAQGLVPPTSSTAAAIPWKLLIGFGILMFVLFAALVAGMVVLALRLTGQGVV